ALGVYVQQIQRLVGNLPGDAALAAHLGVIPHPAQQPVGNTRRTTGAARDLEGAIGVDLESKDAGGTGNDSRQVLGTIELQTLNDTEAVTQRVGQHAGAGGGTNPGERSEER